MDDSTRPGRPAQRFRPSFSRALTTIMLLLIVVVGGYFRTINLTNWDGRTEQHPDERFMHYTVVALSVPNDWRTYFTSACPNPLPAPRNPTDPPDKWEPSADSGCSTLNPRNFNWSRGYVYGTLPTTLTRLVAEGIGKTTATQAAIFGRVLNTGTDTYDILIVGRALSVLADLITLLATFFLARLMFGRRVGLLAAALYAGAVMPIQQSHFFTVDNFAVAFGTLALLFATRLALRPHGWRGWLNAILTGVFIAAATASKINMGALVALVFVALAQAWWTQIKTQRAGLTVDEEAPAFRFRPRSLIRPALLLAVTGVVCFAGFRVFQPDAFTGPNIWNIGLEPRFKDLLSQARLTANGTIDLPSSHQWASRAPWLFPWQNMVVWGMGAPLGLVAWIGWAIIGWQIVARRRFAALAPWFWIALYFAWQGQQFVTTMRYFLPLYPPLVVFAAWALIGVVKRAQQARTIPALPRAARFGSVWHWLQQPRVAIGLLALVLASTWAWAYGYTRIYTRPYTRVAAADWIKRAAPNGATTTWELWDDPLPLDNSYNQTITYPYAEEEPNKYLGKPGAAPGDENAGLIAQLAQTEYVVLTSPRVYGSVSRVPQRFPATIRYYQALFDGSLGFELVADLNSFPSFLGLPVNDSGAEEAFWVYDHPRVLIFRRTDAFSPDRVRQALIGDVAWDEVYRGLRPGQLNAAPTALQLTAGAWAKLQAFDTRYLFTTPLGPIPALLLWLLLIEALGIAGSGILWRLQLPLADRGLNLGRIVGLLLFAIVPALLGTTQRISINRWLLAGWFIAVLIVGWGLLWRDRLAVVRFVRVQWRALWLPQALYGAMLALGIALPSGLLQNAPATVARWTALIRSATFPPYDPFFAGGLDPELYAAHVPFALLDRLLGVAPGVALRYALGSALALTILGVWSAIFNGTTPVSSAGGAASRRRGLHAALAALASLLLIVPGLLLNTLGEASLLGALTAGNLNVLGLSALIATALAIGAGFLRDARRWRSLLKLGAILSLPLVFIRGQGIVPLALVWLLLVGFAEVGGRDHWRRATFTALLALLAAFGLGSAFAWSSTTPALQASSFTITPVRLLVGLLLPAIVVTSYVVVIGAKLADRGVLRIVAGVIVGWTILIAARGWSIALLTVPVLMALTWLAVQAWIPAATRRSWRVGLTLASAAIATVPVILAALVQNGRLPGDVAQLLAVATVLLVVASGWALPSIARALRRRITPERLATISGLATTALLLLGAINVGLILSTNADPPVADRQPVVAAGQWLAQRGTNGAVLVTAPTAQPSLVSSITGLPMLLAELDAQRKLRDAVAPAINGVIDGRQRAIQALYGGDVEAARRALQTYRVGYVLVGPGERAAFGATAGTALDVLAQQNTLQRAYDRDGVQIYAASPPADTPPFVAQPVALTPPSTKTLMLNQPVDTLPVVNEYAWNRLASSQPALAIGLWLLVIELLGLLAFPLVATMFRRWHDRGWGVSKLVGLLIWAYAVWLPVSLGWWLFNWWSLVFGALVLTALMVLTIRRIGRAKQPGTLLLRQLLPSRGALIRSELCFLIAFGLWTLVRAANPDLWHPYFGGEKPFEFGFLNAILRTPVLPPYDPFFSDGIINYYYYGFFLVALPMKAIGLDPAIGFNLAVLTVFAFTASAALALGRELTGRWRYGLLAILFMLGLGTLASVVQVTESKGIGPVVAALRDGLAGFGGRLGFWFWGPSRVIPYTINEFPLFSFLFADLHPQLIDMPITLLALVCAAELARPRARWTTLALSALVIGALAVTNSWDAPTYALAIGGALVARAWRHRRRRSVLLALGRMLQAALVAIVTIVAGLALYLPFFLQYRAMVGGIGIVRSGDRIMDYVLVYGPTLFVGISLFAGLAWAVARQAHARWRVPLRAATAVAPLLIGVILLSGAASLQQPATNAGWPLRILLTLLAITGIVLAFVVRLRDKQWLPLWFFTVGVLVALGIQTIFIRDHLAGSDWERMNTVFKFGLQIWVLWAIGAATAIPLIFRLLRRAEYVLGTWLGLLIVLIVPALVYPVAAIPSRLSTRFDTTIPLTLDGLAFMPRARFGYANKDENIDAQIDLRFDAEAIAWIKQNIAGTPVIATSEKEFYRAYGSRIAANTGLPILVDTTHESEQRPASGVNERRDDVKTLFSTPDPQTALQILAKYHVEYVYVGQIERAYYGVAGAAKWLQMQGSALDLVYRNDGVQLYRVKPDARAAAPVQPQAPPPVQVDTQLQALEAQVAANPNDGAAAFGLGNRYVQFNRLQDAARVLETAARANPRDVPLHHLLGDVLAQLGRPDDAIAAWKQAAETQRTPENVNKLGQGLVQLKRWDEAERVLNEALSMRADFPDPHVFLGELYRGRNGPGDRERAIAEFKKYLEIAPADAPWRSLAESQLKELQR